MNLPRGLTLLLGILLILTGIRYGRAVFPEREEPPAVFRSGSEPNWVALGEGFPDPGVHQFFDGQSPRSVIGMAVGGKQLPPPFDERLDRPLNPGEFLDIQVQDSGNIEILRKWMPASQRIVLGIPLHPDSMVCDDWQALPGIGPKLAERIEADRQKNGEFSSLEDLKRVSGIGKKRIEAWRTFF